MYLLLRKLSIHIIKWDCFRKQIYDDNMTSLRAILSHNMKEQRQRLGISQAKLAERVNTSNHYICMVENGKKFPTPEMLERIAGALEFDAPDLFSTKTYPLKTNGTMLKFLEQVINDMSQVLYGRTRELEEKLLSNGLNCGRDEKG